MKKTMFDFDSTHFIESTMLNCFASSNTSPNRISEQSWTISKKEWDRLINYIRQKLHSYSIEQGLQKAQSARIEINQLIRPLLETLRNNFRNFILSKTRYSDCSIELHPTSLLCPSAICYSCQWNCYLCGQFWIVSDCSHEYRNICHTCSCHLQQHIRIEYKLEWKYLINQSRQTFISREDLLYIIVHLSNFILQKRNITNNDLFLICLNKMIDEERSIWKIFSIHRMNLALYQQTHPFQTWLSKTNEYKYS
jgi:hypothetical protein